VTVGLTTRSPRVADRSLCLLPIDATGWHRSARYVGARQWSALNVSRHSLNWIRCWTGSQWRRSRSAWLMWPYFLVPTSSRAAAFRTDCNLGRLVTDPGRAISAFTPGYAVHCVRYTLCKLSLTIYNSWGRPASIPTGHNMESTETAHWRSRLPCSECINRATVFGCRQDNDRF